MGVHAPLAAPLPRVIALGLSRIDRKAVEAEIERLIALLDTLDGDPDLEDDREDDPLDHGEAWCADELLTMLPVYGVDQSAGPINEREAMLVRGRALYRSAR